MTTTTHQPGGGPYQVTSQSVMSSASAAPYPVAGGVPYPVAGGPNQTQQFVPFQMPQPHQTG